MNLLGVADLVAGLAFLLLTGGLYRDRGEAATGRDGLPWIRLATLLLWGGLALRAGLAESGPTAWLAGVATVGCTGLLHLRHVQGWKGSRARPVGWANWGLAALALGLGAWLRLR